MANENDESIDVDVDEDDADVENKNVPKGKEKVRIILAAVKRIMASYGKTLTFRLNLRMLHYRLVEDKELKGSGIYENTTNNYKWLSKCHAVARRAGEIPWDVFEDKTRTVPSILVQNYTRPERSYENAETDVMKIVERDITALEYQSRWYSLPENLYQPDLVVIMLEKQALENVFKSVIDENKAVLVVNKGYNSLTQLKDFADILKEENRHLHLKCFSDFDPSGVDIQRNFIDQMIDLGISFASVERVALTEDLITKHNFPYAPPKKTDARAKNWKAAGVVELDAIEPLLLQTLITTCVAKHWDVEIAKEVKKLEKVLKRRINRECAKKIEKIRDQIKK